MKSLNIEIANSKKILDIINNIIDAKSTAFIFSIIFHILLFLTIFFIFAGKKSNQDFEIKTLQLVSLSSLEKEQEMQKQVNKNNVKKIENNIINKNSFEKKPITKQEKQEEKKAVNLSSKKLQSSNIIDNQNQSQETAKINSEYVNLIAYKLNKYKSRFSMANSPNKSGTVVFRIILEESGEVKSYQLLQSSNNDFFDKIAEKIISSAKSFPKPPKEIVSLGLEFNVPIIFDAKA